MSDKKPKQKVGGRRGKFQKTKEMRHCGPIGYHQYLVELNAILCADTSVFRMGVHVPETRREVLTMSGVPLHTSLSKLREEMRLDAVNIRDRLAEYKKIEESNKREVRRIREARSSFRTGNDN